ncbi:disease resistance protein L6-like [Cornus florida]|uniref:disease resistance protein L6-like n=1 Tax=Cornus florida TaxID=4283 RepID=UPI0028988460|nr:disease resistance protein L6-like [Cornus florida]
MAVDIVRFTVSSFVLIMCLLKLTTNYAEGFKEHSRAQYYIFIIGIYIWEAILVIIPSTRIFPRKRRHLTASGGEYDVFLSFRGPDIRLNFNDHLYTNLVSAGVRTYRDNNELRKGVEFGPDLLKAITKSRISIPIFTKGYASSKWCLRELAQMVKCKGQLILPIFYDVEPSVVRHQSGDSDSGRTYEQAFREHENHLDGKTVKEWREAMREVGTLDGWEVKKKADGHQGQLIKMIVQSVLMELKRNDMVLSNNLVGIDEHINNITRLLEVGSSEKRIVGIHGIGGIGKTTIAKCIYNKLLKEFECGSFLADILETAKPHKGIVTLQKQLLADTLKWYPDIADANSGINAIQNRFLRTKVLIVLDDLNEKSQFDWLVGNLNWFGPGTRIIVTTRDKKVLIDLGAKPYEPPDMNLVQSVELFSFHAFRMKFPPIGYEKISNGIASTTGGLPLALEVTGSFLFGKNDIRIWEDTLDKLKIMPDDKVQKALRISYDGLNREQQKIFLDIACLFIGMDKTYPFYMWDDCGYFPKREIDVLCLLSLVKIENDNLLRMHDQLRDFGREMVHQEDDINPGGRSRLWNRAEAKDVFEENKGTEKVEVLNLPYWRKKSSSCFTRKTFKKLSYLRYLRVEGAEFVGDFKHCLSRLRWFCWKQCPSNFVATNFHMKNLIILDLSYSFGTPEEWNGWSQIMMSNKLKVLNLSNCGLRRTPDFSTYTTLEILNLERCRNLDEIDPSIGAMKNLKVLNLKYTEIRSLPDGIWELEKLEVLNASFCRSLEGDIPRCIGRLSYLRELRLYNTKIQSLPTNICDLLCLQTLDLDNCHGLQALPDPPSSLEILNVTSLSDRNFSVIPNLANLVNLQKLGFSWRISTLPKEIDALSQLKILTIRGCSDLQCILGLPPNLVELRIGYCELLENSPDLSNLKLLLKLEFQRCWKLTEIQGLGKLQSLTSLTIYDCRKLAEIQGLGKLQSLTSLTIYGCWKLTKIQGLGNLESLSSLNISECYEVTELNLLECWAFVAMSVYKKYFKIKPHRSNLKKLKSFEVFSCRNLNKIQGLDRLVSLEYLNVGYCGSIVRLPNLSNFKMLRHLEISGCRNLREIEGLENLEALKKVVMWSCSSLEEVRYRPGTDIQLLYQQGIAQIDGRRLEIISQPDGVMVMKFHR